MRLALAISALIVAICCALQAQDTKSGSAAKSRPAGDQTVPNPTDFSEESLVALRYALSVAKIEGSELILLHAASEPPRHEVLKEYYRRLNALIPQEARAWCKSDALVSVGDPVEAILKAASEQNADCIVISAHRAEGTFNVPLTMAYQVVAHAHCPVLRVRC